MGQDASIPSFDEWVEYVFTQHSHDAWADYCSPELNERLSRYCYFDENILAEYMATLCSDIVNISKRYNYIDLLRGIDALLSFVSVCIEIVFDIDDEVFPCTPATLDRQLALIRSLEALYVDLFDAECAEPYFGACDEPTRQMYKDTAMYILHWDLSKFLRWTDERHDSTLCDVFEAISLRCNSEHCIRAAVFALASFQATAKIDHVLKSRELSEDLAEYARQGREGKLDGLR